MFKRLVFFVILLQSGMLPGAEEPSSVRERAVIMARTGNHSGAITLLENELSTESPDPETLFDYITILTWAGRHEDAIAQYETIPEEQTTPEFLHITIAKSHRNLQKFETAAAIYEKIISTTPANTTAIAGLAMTLVDRQKYADAINLTTEALLKFPDNPDLLLAKAIAHHEAKELISALKTYDHFLAITPDHRDAINLKARMLADAGAVMPTRDLTSRHPDIITPETTRHISRRNAAQRINWQEFPAATNLLLQTLAGEPEHSEELPLKYDLILALSGMDKFAEVITEYDALTEKKVDLPYWIHDAAAKAYLTLRNPEEAIELYKKALSIEPDEFDSRLGLYYSYLENEQFREAGKILKKLVKETPEWIMRNGTPAYNWNRQRVTIEQGWFLLYQNRLKEGQAFFQSLLDYAPANLAARTGRAHAMLWRGWPHRALEDFDIIITMAGNEPFDQETQQEMREMPARNGRITALNNCYLKNEARTYAAELLEDNPDNTHTIRINRQLDIEDSTEFFLDAVATRENPGVNEEFIYASLKQPLSPNFSLHTFWVNQDTGSLDDNNTYRHQRAGLGFNWNIFPKLSLMSEYSIDYETNDDEGINARLTCRLSDHWTIDGGHNTFSLDVPIRARAEGITGKQTDASLIYKSSDLFDIRPVYSINELDDGNESTAYSLYAGRTLITRAHWRTKLFLEASEGMNSRQDVNYYSPEKTSTYMADHMISHIFHRHYERVLSHRLYTGIGTFDQSLYSTETIWHIRYEHDYTFSDSMVLLWGMNFQRRFYDSEQTDAISWYLTFRKNFK